MVSKLKVVIPLFIPSPLWRSLLGAGERSLAPMKSSQGLKSGHFVNQLSTHDAAFVFFLDPNLWGGNASHTCTCLIDGACLWAGFYDCGPQAGDHGELGGILQHGHCVHPRHQQRHPRLRAAGPGPGQLRLVRPRTRGKPSAPRVFPGGSPLPGPDVYTSKRESLLSASAARGLSSPLTRHRPCQRGWVTSPPREKVFAYPPPYLC